MQVILLERIEKLGQMGDVMEVKPGYARNFLLPQKKALRATKENLVQFESQKKRLEAENLEQREEAEAVAKKMDGLGVVLLRQASESEQLYGSVNARDILAAIAEAGFTLDRKQVLLDHPLKTLGVHTARIALHPEVIVEVAVNVSRSAEEAKLRTAGKKTEPAPAEKEETPAQKADEVFEESVLEELSAEAETAEAGTVPAEGADEEKPQES